MFHFSHRKVTSPFSSGRRDEVDQVGWCIAVQTTMNNRTQLVLDALLNRKPVAISQQGGHVITSR